MSHKNRKPFTVNYEAMFDGETVNPVVSQKVLEAQSKLIQAEFTLYDTLHNTWDKVE